MKIRRIRLIILTGAFLVIAINPFTNKFLHINFIQGWYQSIAIGKLWFVSPLEGLEAILIAKRLYLPLLIAMLPPVLLAFLLGRVFCSWICPISFFSEILEKVAGYRDRLRLPRMILWFSLIGELLISLILGAPIFVFMSPPGLVGREIMMAVFFGYLAVEGIFVVAVLGSHLISRRLFCRYLCPLGALLALIGGKRRLRVAMTSPEDCINCGICNRHCPLGLDITGKKESLSIYCWNCGECVSRCPRGVLSFRWISHPQSSDRQAPH